MLKLTPGPLLGLVLALTPSPARSLVVVESLDVPTVTLRIVGEIGYAAGSPNGLLTLDASAPNAPAVLGSLPTPALVLGIDVHDGVAYLAQGPAGLEIVDVTDPGAPASIARLPTSSWAWSVRVAGDLAYVADGSGGLHVVDVSDPASPSVVTTFPADVWRVELVGDVAFLSEIGFNGLLFVDVSDPTSPREIGRLPLGLVPREVHVVGNLVYVAASENLTANSVGSLLVVDVSDPAHAVPLGSIGWNDRRVGWPVVVEDLAYLSVSTAQPIRGPLTSGGLAVVDVSDPSAPHALGEITTADRGAGAVAVLDGSAWVASGSGLRVVDLSLPTHPAAIGDLGARVSTQDVALRGDLAVTAELIDGIRTIDVSVPEAPTPVGQLGTSFARELEIGGDRAYLADDLEGLRVIDLSDPTGPFEIGRAAPRVRIVDVEVAGEVAWVGDSSSSVPGAVSTLRAIDVSDPISPVELSAIETSGTLHDIAIAGTLALAGAGNEGIQVFDISDPRTPMLLSEIASTLLRDIEIQEPLAFVAEDRGLRIFDLSDPSAPVELGQMPLWPRVFDLELANGRLYVAVGEGGVRVIDVADPARPRLFGGFETPGEASGVAIRRSLVFVADNIANRAGLRVFDLGPEYDRVAVAIDVKPGNDRNRVNPDSRGLLEVALLSSADFAALDVDAATVRLGPGEAVPTRVSARDVDRDGVPDAVLRFRTDEIGAVRGDDLLCMRGLAPSGASFEGCDRIDTPDAPPEP